MMGRSLEEVRAKNPPVNQEEYERAYAASTLALELAQLAYRMREKAGMSQNALAKKMGTTQSAIARLEGGGVVPKLDLLARLSRATGVPLRLDSGSSRVELGRELHVV